MARIDWHLKGYDLTTCSCAAGCPCQFMSLPTQGYCHAAVCFQVETGHFGSVNLDGLAFAGLFAWPQAIHFGNGEAQPVVDVRANAQQREALLRIISGEETEPGATIFNVFATTYSKVHEPLFARISLELDRAAGTGRFTIEDLAEGHIEPIRNPVTGDVVRARIVMPAGFEYDEAEVVSSTVRTQARSPIKLDWSGRHAHLAALDMTGAGVNHARR